MVLLDRLRSTLLAPDRLEPEDIWAALDRLIRPGVDAADVYLQSRRHTSLRVSAGKVVSSRQESDRGAGLRAIAGDSAGFCFTQEPSADALLACADTAAAVSRITADASARRVRHGAMRDASHQESASFPLPRRIAMLQEIEAEARAADPRIVQAAVELTVDDDDILLANDQGLFHGDIRRFARLTIEVGLLLGQTVYFGVASRGTALGETYFDNSEVHMWMVRRAFEAAERSTRAVPFVGGTMPVVIGPGWSGVLFHEAVGHGLEGDLTEKQVSPYSGRIGEQIAASSCTIVDDGSLPNCGGSMVVDDEGTPCRRNVLVDGGVLKGYMHDRRSARAAGVAPTGNGRRQSYAYLPMPRMTNTFLEAGALTPGEVIASVDQGLYCADLGSGQIDITSGKFVFPRVTEAYAIEGGKLTRPVSGVRLVGDGAGVIANLALVADDLAFDDGVATCGKASQEVIVGVGQPTIRVDAMTVGGSA